MNPSGLYPESPNSIALIGNYLPRQCGIATFTTDLLEALATEAPEMDCWAMVMNDVPEGYPYPNQVRFELNDWNLADHGLAADFLNMNRVDAVCLQHEFGIFGGNRGSHILELLRNLRMPVITTLHTVLREPDPERKAIFQELGSVSDRLVVMSHKAEEILKEVYGMPQEKIIFIHHGIPDVPFVDPNYYKEQFGVEGRKVILTFGLISPRKSIEDMIDALPAIVSKHPETAYIVLGATHPNVIRKEGESYRLSLQLRAREKGVEDHLIFHNRFVHLTELCEFLGAADIYATLYFDREQAVSGTLAYALGAGKAVISTPYPYAEEMLNHGRGRIVPPHDSDALAAQVIDLFDNEVERHAMRKRAYTFSRNMIWKEVARRYLELFIEVKNDRQQHPRIRFRTKTLSATSLELPQLNLRHLNLLTDDVGILQHAKFIVPERSNGYCTDDNTRALVAVMMARELLPDDTALTDLACRYLGFLYHALNDDNSRFRNYMGYDRTWLEEQGSEDCHGRAVWGLGMAVSLSTSGSFTGAAMTIFERALQPMVHFQSPRARAFGLVGIHAYLQRFGGDTEARRVREVLANALFDQFQAYATDDWPWIENEVNNANARIPQALLLSGRWLHREDMISAGLRSLDWLVGIQTDPKGHFVPIGNHGWFTRDGQRAIFDQEPLETQNMIEACLEAYRITGEKKWTKAARRCFDWFLGRNDLNVPLYDYRTGGCCDGLTADGANQNQGAKSTLAWLLSLLSLHSLMALEATDRKPDIT